MVPFPLHRKKQSHGGAGPDRLEAGEAIQASRVAGAGPGGFGGRGLALDTIITHLPGHDPETEGTEESWSLTMALSRSQTKVAKNQSINPLPGENRPGTDYPIYRG